MAKADIVVADDFAALAPSTEGFSLMEVMQSNFGPQGLRQENLQRVKVPSGGAISWQIDTIEGTDSTKAITGIIVAVRDVRVYYDKPFDGSNAPPACYSPNGVTGMGDPGGSCQTCKMAQWGSDAKGRGQACSMRRMLLVLEEDSILPLVISAPPGSLKNIEQYFGRLAGRRLPHYAVVSSLELENDKNPEGIAYSRIKPRYLRELRPDEVVSLKEYMEAVLPAFQTVSEVEAPKEDAPY